MRIKKGTSWTVGILVLTGLYGLTLWLAPEQLSAVGPTIVLAIAFGTVGYQGAQVADNWQRSANYRPELDNRRSDG